MLRTFDDTYMGITSTLIAATDEELLAAAPGWVFPNDQPVVSKVPNPFAPDGSPVDHFDWGERPAQGAEWFSPKGLPHLHDLELNAGPVGLFETLSQRKPTLAERIELERPGLLSPLEAYTTGVFRLPEFLCELLLHCDEHASFDEEGGAMVREFVLAARASGRAVFLYWE
ncbi:MAG: hypothetical protein AAGE52_36865 [Myxococcota bacterium]